VVRAEGRERTRDALLDAADRTFFPGGWEQMSLTEMAVSAGVTKQTLLRHFGSKDGLLVQAQGRGFERVRQQRWAAPTHDLTGGVDNLLDHYEQLGERAMRSPPGAVTARRWPTSVGPLVSCTPTGSSTRSKRGWTGFGERPGPDAELR